MKKLIVLMIMVLLLAACNVQPAPLDIETQATPWTFLADPALTTNGSTIGVQTALRGNDRPVIACDIV